MKPPSHIRLARRGELETVEQLIASQLPDLIQPGHRRTALNHQLSDLIEDGCLIIAEANRRCAGLLALDLMQQQIIACHLDTALLDKSAPQRMIHLAEQRALCFGIRSLCCAVQVAALSFVRSLGYTPDTDEQTEGMHIVRKRLDPIAEPWQRAILHQHAELGIPEDYGARHRFPMVEDCRNPELIGLDIYDREQWLAPAAAAAWREMRDAAANAGVVLQVVSAFRSRDYQANLIRAKLDKGLTMKQILRVSAAPGFSQHHSGRALDLKTPGSSALEQDFADTSAYRWLTANARYFGFTETLPRNNRHGIIWEPWHWYYGKGTTRS